MAVRLALVIVGFMGAYSALLFRLYDLQVRHADTYVSRAEALTAGVIQAERGTIFFTDRDGKRLPAATVRDMPLIFAVPKELEDVPEAVNALAPLLGLEAGALEKSLSKPNDSYELLLRRASPETAAAVGDLEMKGVYVRPAPERFYPFGTVASHFLGFVGANKDEPNMVGRYGLENYYEDTLAGEDGEFRDGALVAPRAGGDLVTTLDANIQLEAERILVDLVKKHEAQGGTVVVQDPQTGKILAMASVPNFDPNVYGTYNIGVFLNPATQAVYEPGSVFKVITMAAGLDADKIVPETSYYDEGSITVSGRTIRNWDLKAHGWVTMTEVIEKSLNTGAAYAEKLTGNDVFLDYVRRFGFGEKTNIDLPAEVRGDFRHLTPKAPQVLYATASFGQGIAVTPIELITAFSAIANGGTLYRPYVNSALTPQAVTTPIAARTAERVTKMMVSAVDKAEIGVVPGYSLAGKTGTAFIPDFGNGGYTDRVINTYIGFGPAPKPAFTILIKLIDPAGAPVAGQTVVPAFRDLSQFILNYFNIPPDRAMSHE